MDLHSSNKMKSMFRPSPPDARRPPELLRVAPRRTRPRGRCARLENERLLHVHADDATPPPAMADPDFVRGLAASPPRSRVEWRRCLGPVSEVTAELVEAVAAVDVRSLACWTPAQTNWARLHKCKVSPVLQHR